MYCKKCGAEIPDDSELCPDCGARLFSSGRIHYRNKSKYESEVKNGIISEKMAKGVTIIVAVFVMMVMIVLIKPKHKDELITDNGLTDSKTESIEFQDGLFIVELKGNIQSDGIYNNSSTIYRIDMESGKSTKISFFKALADGYDCYYWGLRRDEGYDEFYQKACIVFKDGGSQHVGWIDTDGNITDVSKLYIGEKTDDFYGNEKHTCPKFDRSGYFYFLDAYNRTVIRVCVDDVDKSKFEVVATDIADEFCFIKDGVIGIGDCNYNSQGDKDIKRSDIWLTDDEYISSTNEFPVCLATKPGNYGAINIQYNILSAVEGRVNESPVLSPDRKEIAFLSYLQGENIVNLFTVSIAPDQKPIKVDADLEMKIYENTNSHTSYLICEWRGEETDVLNQSNERENYSSDNVDIESASNNESVTEGPLPDYIYEEIKGTYYASINFLTLRVISSEEIEQESGGISTCRIEKYEYKGDELVLYIMRDGSKTIFTSFADDKGNRYLCLLEGGGWDYDKAHVYSSVMRISQNISVGESQIKGKYDYPRYYAPEFELDKIGNDYWLVPKHSTSYMYSVEDGEAVSFTEEIKISKDAKIGVATSLFTGRDGTVEVFSYEYFDYYDEIDNLISSQHWIYGNDGELCFVVDYTIVLLCPIVYFDSNGEVALIMDGIKPDDLCIVPFMSSDNEVWYGADYLADGDAYEGGMPEETFAILKGDFVGDGFVISVISSTQVTYTDSAGKTIVLDVYGCDVDNDALNLYVCSSGNDYYPETIYRITKESDGEMKLLVGSGGTWDFSSNHWVAEAKKAN